MRRPAYVGLGANQGEARETLDAALESLRVLEKSELVAVSPYYLTAPIDAEGPDYLNAVVRLDTELEPYALLLHLLDLELMLGRKRRGAKRNAPRSVDLDLLLYDELSLQSAPLTLPHPRMHRRAFVLRPLADLAPGLIVPGQGSVESLLAGVADQRVEPCPHPA
jgi:2-amino-4-hydroxy-6-hydroxymethyldihydropteridine diphosphokinase